MLEKRAIGLAIFISAAALIVPLDAQQPPVPSQPTPIQAPPGSTQPAVPSEPGAPPVAKPPVIPRRTPVPAQSPGVVTPQGPGPSAVPQPGTGVAQPTPSPEDAQGPQVGPGPSGPQRRLPPPQIPSSGMVSLNFNRADLVEIIHIIAQQLRLTYTIDPEVKGTVTINSAEPLRAEDLLPIFHQLLRMNGAVAVRTGNLYHIMPIKDGKGLARPLGQGKEDSFALQVIPVRFFSVAEMKRVLTPFLQPGGEIVENPRGNFLIVMDLPSNIQRLMEIAEMIDVQVFAGTRMEIYQPKVASAEELAQEMTKVMQSFASSVPQAESFAAQFVALPRINQLLVISHSEAAWTYAKRWLDRLDIIAEGPGRRIFIYPVENGKATELADVLSQALGQPSTGRRDTTRTLQELHRSTPGGTNPTPGRGTTGTGSFGTSGSFGQQSQPLGAYAAVPAPGQVTPPPVVPSAPTPLPPTAPRPPAQTPQAQQQQQQQEQLRIVPDPATNSLIIYGTVQEFQNIKNILKELDAIPRQVLIEAMILQVDLTDTESLGVDIEILRRPRVTIFGQTFASQGALRTLANNFPTAPTFGSGSGLSGIVGGRDVQAIINALMTDARVKLISSPSVLAADNRPARIQVGSEEPIPTGTINAVVGSPGVSSSTTIQYRNTGRILTILPQVNTKGLVNLQIKAEVSARGDDVTVGQDRFPAFNTQDAETTAVVEDGETLVIGGLIGERKSKSRTGIPYLMDIPVVGRFFGTTTDQAQRTELIMLITPRVIRSRDEAQTASEEFKSKLGAVRNELDRIERERAKSKPNVPPPAQTPAIPKEEIPPPAPSRTAPGAGAMWAPPYDSIASLVNQGQVLTPVTPAEPTIEATPMLQLMSKSKSDAQPAAQQNPAKRAGVVARPAYALSFAPYEPPVPLAPSRNMIARLAQPRINREWAVQLAALAEKKDAESIVNTLQKNGYEAYVMTIQTGAKTWHRVRVGQMADVKVANELKKTLASTTAFKQAYVAAN
jgi:general secretion pathway protein D